jgi:hypothetical protein
MAVSSACRCFQFRCSLHYVIILFGGQIAITSPCFIYKKTFLEISESIKNYKSNVTADDVYIVLKIMEKVYKKILKTPEVFV